MTRAPKVLFDERLLFVHVPKTGGVSITKFLIDNLPGKMFLVEEKDQPDASIRLPARVRAKLGVKSLLKRWGLWLPRSVTIIEGSPHARLLQAEACLTKLGRRLGDFRAILAVVRNPYDLEVSRYHFLRKGWHGVNDVARGPEQKFALDGSFEQFALKAPFHGRLPARIEAWYEIDGRMPENLRIVRFENLEEEFRRAVGEFCPTAASLPRLNASDHEPYASYLTPVSEEAIYKKYRWLFDRNFYAREQIGGASTIAAPVS
jgi:hypothetical protein